MVNSIKRYEEEFYVRDYEVGYNGLASAASLANYLQDAAGKHADVMDFSQQRLMDDGIAWVLTRLRIKIERLPEYHEKLKIETWPSTFTKRQACRDFRILDENHKIICNATSNWITFDLNSRKMVPLPQYVIDNHPDNAERSLEFDSRSLPKLTENENSVEFRVRESDIDYNNHVNNVHFIEWAVESIPFEKRQDKIIKEVDVMFRAEGKMGDSVISKSSETTVNNGFVCAHSIVRKADGVEMARLKTVLESK